MVQLKKDFTEGRIVTPMMLFTLPLILSGVLQQLYSVADNIIVGKFSGDPLALAAVGTTGSVTSLFLNFIIGISAGSSILAAQFLGAKDDRAVERTVHTAMSVSVIMGIVFGALGFFLSEQILIWIDTPTELVGRAALYMRIIFLGAPAMSLYNFSAAILRAAGDSKTSMYALSGSGIINVILNVFFVLVCHLTVDGVAYATIISQYVSAAVTVFVLIKRKNEVYGLNVRRLRLDMPIFLRMIRLGIPAGVQSSLFSLSNIAVTAAVNQLSTAEISARAIFLNLINVPNAASSAFTTAAMTFAGQNFGAKKPKRITASCICAAAQSLAVVFAVSMTIFLLIEPVASLYIADDDPARGEIIEIIRQTCALILPLYALSGGMNALAGSLRGMGVSITNMVVSLIGVCGFRILWVITAFNVPALHNLPGVYLAWPISWMIVIVALLGIFIYHGSKLKKKVENEAKCK